MMPTFLKVFGFSFPDIHGIGITALRSALPENIVQNRLYCQAQSLIFHGGI